MTQIERLLRFFAPQPFVAIPVSTKTFSTAIFDTRPIFETH